jgi:hypothetical protein
MAGRKTFNEAVSRRGEVVAARARNLGTRARGRWALAQPLAGESRAPWCEASRTPSLLELLVAPSAQAARVPSVLRIGGVELEVGSCVASPARCGQPSADAVRRDGRVRRGRREHVLGPLAHSARISEASSLVQMSRYGRASAFLVMLTGKGSMVGDARRGWVRRPAARGNRQHRRHDHEARCSMSPRLSERTPPSERKSQRPLRWHHRGRPPRVRVARRRSDLSRGRRAGAGPPSWALERLGTPAAFTRTLGSHVVTASQSRGVASFADRSPPEAPGVHRDLSAG